MASIVLTAANQTFTIGETVSAYLSQSWRAGGGKPSRAAVGSAAVAADGTLTITGATAGVEYILHGATSGLTVRYRLTSVHDYGIGIGTGDTHTNTTIDNVSTSSGSFRIGQRITGPGIPDDTIIVNVVSTTLTLSRATTATTSTVALKADGYYTPKARTLRRRIAAGTL